MSNIKRTFEQLGIPGLSRPNKRPRSPQLVALNLGDPGGSNQPPNAASASTQDPPAQLLPPTSIRGKSNATGHAILSTLKGSMKLLRKGCGGFPPLESAAEMLLDVLDTIETTACGSQLHALHDLASELPQWAVVLSTYVSEQNPEGMSRGIEDLSKTLREQAQCIRKQQQSGKLKKLLASEREYDELQACYRHIESAFQQLQDSQLKELSPSRNARYDSSFSNKIERGKCLENTRTTVLDTVRHWIYSNSGAKIYWMNGMAGTGKTTIAFNVCAELEKNGLLGASFFCSLASSECDDVSRILPTIAYQLAQHSYPFRCALCKKLGQQPDIGQRSISMQFECLIQLPLLEVQDALPNGLVIVIDALDECSNPKTTETMLKVLLDYSVHLPIRFFLTSRPEPSISIPILTKPEDYRLILYLHDVEKSLVKADIETYLTVTLANLSLPVEQIKQLTDQAGILFIYAATVSRYILGAGHRNGAILRLATVLAANTHRGSKKDQEIDRLYKTILAAAIDHEKLEDYEVEMIQRVLWTVVCVKEPVTAVTLAEFLMMDFDQVMAALQPLRSVVNISQDDSTVSTLHASFPDFLLSPDRSERFHCNPQGHNSYLAAQCFWHMKRTLQFNICGLETSFQLDQEVLDLELRVEQSIAAELLYACRYWSDHLASATISAEILVSIDSFLRHQLLFWIEVLSLKKWSGYGDAMLSQLMDLLSGNDDYTGLRDFARDARNFATTFAANPCSLSTPHIYISVLPLTSRESRVWKTYWPQMQGLLQVKGVAMDVRGKSALATWVAGQPVNSIAISSDGKRVVSGSGSEWEWGNQGKMNIWNTSSGISIIERLEYNGKGFTSVAFSPDDTRVASGSLDHTICIWDATKGELVAGPLLGHSSAITSIAFSTDGTCLASGSEDSTIRMWDAYSGAHLGEPFMEHQGTITSVAFSPNGKYLASSSNDCTIRVWDLQVGTIAYTPIGGHKDVVHSIAYSHEGLRLASGSADHTIRVWDMCDGTLLSGPFEGHTDAVRSVAFSPDGTRVVSGSSDRTIRVWEATSGRLLAGPLEGHSGWIHSVLFTMDGTRILSSSEDGTIRIWDARQVPRGATQSLGHTSGINSVALSSDGTRIASGSDDRTICVWDTNNGTLATGPLMCQTGGVLSVAFSPDGARIVSGFWDHTLLIWNASTGVVLVGPIEGHTDHVQSVAFSPDGGQIASGSFDCTIWLWNSQTGVSVAEPFRGHTHTVTSIAFSPNGSRIVSGSYDRTIRMWDTSKGITLWTSDAHTYIVRCVAFSPDGARVVSGSWDCTILVSGASDGAVLHGPFTGHTGWVNSVAFSPDGTRVVSGSLDKTVRVWDVESGTMVACPLKGHTDWVSSVVFSPDGARTISGSYDRTIRIWDVDSIVQASPTSCDDWSIDENGWLTNSSSQRLFWVPSDLRQRFGFLTPSNPVVINADCTVRIDEATLLGDRWHGCYNGSLASVFD